MLKIESIEPGSYASDIGLETGDQLITINGHVINDLIDYHLHVEPEHLVLEVLRQDDELWELDLEKLPGEDVGIEVEHPQPKQCGNQCVFCFVHQLPRGMRRTLYIKDEDYRFSYLYGSYITLSNLSESDMTRIIDQQLSPLYISVHAVSEQVRKQLLRADTPDVKGLLQRLTSGGIDLHCQIVLCPGFNDGSVLDETIEFLASLSPQVRSLAVVPVGLTDHRNNLPELRRQTEEEAQSCLTQIGRHQNQYLTQLGSRFVFPADEIYLRANQDLPTWAEYEDFPQVENGVGMIAQFRQQATEVLLDADTLEIDSVSLVSGALFADELKLFAERLSLRTGVDINVFAVDNNFFGTRVTVTGLLTGADLIAQLKDQDLGGSLLIPDVMIKDDEFLLLDDIEIKQLELELGVSITVVDSSPWGILEGLEQISEGPVEIVHCSN
jgi:putative radical SAM enzyme (TIGR03279 family)